MAIYIKSFFDQNTATITYIVIDVNSRKAAIIDSVLDYDQYSGKTDTYSASQIINYVKENNLLIEWILDTHIHADHFTAAYYLKEKLGGKIGISVKIKDVLTYWVPIFNTEKDTQLDGSQFDCLFDDNETFELGATVVKVMHTPGHTPACCSYLVENSIFVGDTLFMPDIGTARTDFPGGNAAMLYESIQKILSLPNETEIYVGHDYPTEGRNAAYVTTVSDQKQKNILVHDGISKDEYVLMRNKRDNGKSVPKLLLPSIQANLRAGRFGEPEDNGIQYIKIPINQL